MILYYLCLYSKQTKQHVKQNLAVASVFLKASLKKQPETNFGGNFNNVVQIDKPCISLIFLAITKNHTLVELSFFPFFFFLQASGISLSCTHNPRGLILPLFRPLLPG